MSLALGSAWGPQHSPWGSRDPYWAGVMDVLGGSDSRSALTGGGRRRYFVSDSVDGFARLASLFLGEDVAEDVNQVDITAF